MKPCTDSRWICLRARLWRSRPAGDTIGIDMCRRLPSPPRGAVIGSKAVTSTLMCETNALTRKATVKGVPTRTFDAALAVHASAEARPACEILPGRCPRRPRRPWNASGTSCQVSTASAGGRDGRGKARAPSRGCQPWTLTDRPPAICRGGVGPPHPLLLGGNFWVLWRPPETLASRAKHRRHHPVVGCHGCLFRLRPQVRPAWSPVPPPASASISRASLPHVVMISSWWRGARTGSAI